MAEDQNKRALKWNCARFRTPVSLQSANL